MSSQKEKESQIGSMKKHGYVKKKDMKSRKKFTGAKAHKKHFGLKRASAFHC